MTRVWILPVLLVVCGVLVATGKALDGSPGGAAGFFLLFALLACVASPLVFPRSVGAAEAALRAAVDGRPVVYWRPGCAYCLRLRVRLGVRGRRAYWVNIWRDAEGAAVVRGVTGGDETVPTVVVGSEVRVNPDPAWVRARL
ncbi:glutaredoxin domain-containing protein [Streptomyces sp. NPDC093089]|uniref:glutaredoxin domain-containing protein n=1 Tax=Streptomyces sp. NPDC093089 TaxID=3366024 RepID=UPI0038102906